MKLSRKLPFLLSAVLMVIAGGMAGWKYYYPYGHRPCCMPCVMSALVLYADDHDEFYPDGAMNPIENLRKLSNYVHTAHLAGVSGDRVRFEQLWKSGVILPEGASSWQYFPGLRRDDPPGVAILWERASGISGNGRRFGAGGHSVGFADGTMRYVSGTEWASFTNAQGELRQEILSKRRSGMGSPTPQIKREGNPQLP